MGLTEQQRRWNELVEETLKNQNKKRINGDNLLINNSTIADLYNTLKEKILQINQENISIVKRSNYISFKTKTNNQNFVDVQLQKSVIKCVVNLKKWQIIPDNKLRDVSKLGHFGSGDFEVTIQSKDDILLIIPIIKKSYIKNFDRIR